MRFQHRVTAVVFAIAFVVASTASSRAAFVGLPSPTPETPGVAMDPYTGPLTGTVLATLDSPFVDNALPTPFAAGTFYSMVVDRGGGLLDFIYQLANTSEPPADFTKEFFRIKTTGGFDPSLIVSVAQTDSLSLLDAGSSGFDSNHYPPGDKPAGTADRDVATLGSIGFDFPMQPPLPFIGDPRNIGQDESSAFLIVRTNATQYGMVRVAISGAATSFASAFAPIPEPASLTMALFGAVGAGFGFRCTHSATKRGRV